MTEAQVKFVTYIRTRMFFKQQLRGLEKRPPINVSQKEIRDKFFPYPNNWHDDLAALVYAGELSVSESISYDGGKLFRYEALQPGTIDISILRPKLTLSDSVLIKMREYLKSVSLPEGASSTQFFDLFLKHKDNYIELFFRVDDFSGRVHTPLTNFHREYRPNITLDGQPTIGIDVTTMQPLLLGKLLSQAIGTNEYSTWINSGEDIYILLQQKAGLETRDEGKKRFFEILFSRPNNSLAAMFGDSTWINWVNWYKTQSEPRNPHNSSKPHSNLAWLLQTTEVGVMRKVWHGLVGAGIPFLSVHDEIIVKISDRQVAEQVFRAVMRNEFTFHNLNTKEAILDTKTGMKPGMSTQLESAPQATPMCPEYASAPIHFVPLPPPPDVKHDYVAADGILYTYLPGLPELL